MNLHPFPSCRLLLVAALTVPILAPSTQAQDRVLKMGKPEQVGMSAARLEIVNKILTEETKSGRVTAASVLVARRGTIVLRGGWGTLAPDPASPKVGPETVYILASSKGTTQPMSSGTSMPIAAPLVPQGNPMDEIPPIVTIPNPAAQQQPASPNQPTMAPPSQPGVYVQPAGRGATPPATGTTGTGRGGGGR